MFQLRITFGEQYPDKPPRVRFTSEVFHPNVSGFSFLVFMCARMRISSEVFHPNVSGLLQVQLCGEPGGHALCVPACALRAPCACVNSIMIQPVQSAGHAAAAVGHVSSSQCQPRLSAMPCTNSSCAATARCAWTP